MLYYFLDVIRILFIFDNTIFLNLEERDMNKKTIGLVPYYGDALYYRCDLPCSRG